MREIVDCEGCKTTSTRALERLAPAGWYYMLVTVELPPDGKPEQVYVYACSKTCAMKLWEPGPGPAGPPVLYSPRRAER